jgi:hypothetical protein
VPVAVIMAVGIAGAATPELRHPCRSPCPKTRKRHEGESCPSGRDPPPRARALVAHCWPAGTAPHCCPLLHAACRLPLAMPPALVAVVAAAACDAACASCCSGCCNGTAAAAAAAGAAAAAPIAAAAPAQAALAATAPAACFVLRAACCKPHATRRVQHTEHCHGDLCCCRCCCCCCVLSPSGPRRAPPAPPARRRPPLTGARMRALVPTRLRRWPVRAL